MRKLPIAFGVGVLFFCVFLRRDLEADPVLHVLVLLPGLAVGGGLIVSGISESLTRPRQSSANALVLVSVFTVLFWMLPRYIDASLTSGMVKGVKFLTLTVLVGACLNYAWKWAHPFLRGFVKANAISMLGVLSFLYVYAPVRICNSYLVSDQERLGVAFLLVAFVLSFIWSAAVFLPSGNSFRRVSGIRHRGMA